MRQFALADPHYYVLELIQAGVANGATHLNLDIEKRSFGMSYVGGGFVSEELAQLFDFLFASKKDVAHGDMRQLALGVNALMILEPDSIVIESGDGTLDGTTRIEIRTDQDTVDVGTPDKALRGTFVRAEGLSRRAIRGKSNLSSTGYGPPECMAIENRCLAAPVPIIVNDQPIFGYSSVRTPNLFGYKNVVTFDEGDLYGSIGVAAQQHNRNFKLLTWGTWVQSIEHALVDDGRLGGVVSYDGLNKTADHSGIVRDERLAQMWARLNPYAHKAASGESGRAVFQIAPLGGDFLSPRKLREMLVDTDAAVAVPEMLDPDGNAGQLAQQIGHVLEAPVLRVPEDEMPTLRNLAGSRVRLLRPDLTNPDELAFFRQPRAAQPERPWIIAPIELDPVDVDAFVEHLVSEELVERDVDKLRERLGGGGQIQGTVYTPVDSSHGQTRSDQEQGNESHDNNSEQARELWVRVRTLDRIVWEGAITSAYPGHVLDVDVPAISPSSLLQPVAGGAEFPLAQLIAEVTARYAVPKLSRASARTLESLAQFDIEPGSTGARVALAALARNSVKRLRSKRDDGGPAVRFSIAVADTDLDPLGVPIFATLDGASVTMRELAEMMERTCGLVYGVVAEVEPDLEGLDPSRILDLDLETERLLTTIVGESAYVRIDRRHVLAEEGGFRVRDMALGLRDYPDGALLVEGPAVEQGRTPDEATVEALVGQLLDLYGGATRGATEECRRQAVRHLQHFACHRLLEAPEANAYGAQSAGLFLDGRAQAVSLQDIQHGFEAHSKLMMIDGRSSDVTELGALVASKVVAKRAEPAEGPPSSLLMNSWVLDLLEPFGELRGAFDFDLTDAEAADVEATPESAFMISRAVEGEGLSGRVGLPEDAVDEPAIAVISSDNQRVFRLVQPAIEHGVVGIIRVRSGEVEEQWEAIYSAAMSAGRKTVAALADDLSAMEPGPRRDRALEVIFGYAGRRLRIAHRPDDTIRPEISDGLAQHILDIPVFASRRGIPASAQRLINQFCVEQTRGSRLDASARLEITDEVPAVLRTWLERHLRPENIARPATDSAQRQPAEPGPASRGDASSRELTPIRLAKLVEAWLNRLRPDDHHRQLAANFANSSGSNAGRVQRARSMADEFRVNVRVIDPTSAEQRRWLPDDRLRQSAGDMEDDDAFVYTAGRPPVLVINVNHWLAKRVMEADGADPQPLAWLLLAAYSHINALLEPVTNDHELAFQLRVGEALRNGELAG